MRKEYVDWGQVEALLDRLLAVLPRDFDVILAITRGGLIPACLLSYRGRMRSMLVAVEHPPLDLDDIFGAPIFCQFPADPLLKGKRVLIVDGMWSTARTMMAVKTRVEQAGGRPELCVLHYRPQGVWGEPKPDYVGEETDAWIIYPWEPSEEAHVGGPQPVC